MTTTIEQLFAEGRLIRNQWSGTDPDGRQLLCLYTALVGDPDARPETCPGHVAAKWLAALLPWIDDAGTVEHWPDVVKRVVALAPRFATLPPETEWRVRALCVREAMRHTDDANVLAVCERVAVLCERRGRGEVVADEEFEAARAATWAWAAARAAARAAAAAAMWAATATTATATAWAAAKAAADRLIDAILDEIERSA